MKKDLRKKFQVVARCNTATEMQNFLKHAPLQLFNLKPENGVIDLQADLTPYSYLYLVAVDGQ